MLSMYKYPKFDYRKPAELAAGENGAPGRYPVVVVGAGPVGLAAAIDLAIQGQKVVVLDNDDTVSIGSRGVCYAKRALEVLDRLGCGDEMVDKGVSWNVGRTFFREEEVFNFNLCPEPDHHRPGMINLQQYYLEEYLVKRAEAVGVELRWKNTVIAVNPGEDSTGLRVETPDGAYNIDTDWLIVADGARSSIRAMLGLDIEGKIFMDRFLIADVVMKADFPTERWFWFDPPFHRNQSVLLHRQADNVFRIDFQLGWNVDPEVEKKPENVVPRIKAMLGDDREFDLEWVSVYTFQCRRMHSFRHGRVLFVGDAAHQVSPFGARGANSGIQDTDNLAWKLKLVMDGKAPAALLDTYSEERVFAADENLMNSTRSTDFITPKSTTSKTFRNAVLGLAEHYPFARALVNSGRLSVPAYLTESRLNTADADSFAGKMVPGAPMDDAPVKTDSGEPWLLKVLGNRFQLLYITDDASRLDAATASALAALAEGEIPVQAIVVAKTGTAPAGLKTVIDTRGRIAERYDAQPGTCYLARPDQHVAARWRAFDAAAVKKAVAVATCNA
ncbi:FAD-dependent oxidoreductase [Denitromonas iodatirespirans]|uniref:FAD-dependent oxidoreductase n=1 Tax=Denitromonas iodatirespirans TaxID=2795389 RepID=A0A944DBT5_DENI1|nr:FAD-dependent oxidoreductase [Denitromonas iodatirespirans]MBT0963900.1 FAD-dependent oxidoreductase [Denitromonas iodatirespirans]